MRNAEYLLCSAKHSELFRHALRRDAGYAGVDLVKDQRVYAVLFGKDVLEREHDARKLAAGSDAADRAKRFTGVRRHDEADLIRAGGGQGVFPFAGKKPHLKADRRHAEIPKLADDALLEPLCRSFAAVESALTQGAEFMMLFVPGFAGILAASGTLSGAVAYQTAVVLLADSVMQLITRVLLPLCTMGFSLAIVDAVSPSVSVGGLLRLSRKCTTWILGLLMTVFLGVLSMQNWLGSSVDTAASKTTKYVIANFVPVVGSAVSDAYTTVRSSLQMLRSTTGVVGMVSLCVLFLPPLVQLLLYRGVVAIGAAAAELFGTRSLLRLLRGTQQALAIAFALLVCFGVMFVVSTAIAMTIGKGAV